MKKTIFLFVIFIFSINTIRAQENDTTTYYLIRHAEKVRKDKSDKNPNLTKKGLARAENWSNVFKEVNFDFIYSTNYNRTIQTAEPTAKSKNLEIQIYSPNNAYNDKFKSITKGKTVLIVGHSNTTPLLVNDILAEEKYEQIKDDNNSNLYIVTIKDNAKSSLLLRIPFE